MILPRSIVYSVASDTPFSFYTRAMVVYTKYTYLGTPLFSRIVILVFKIRARYFTDLG